MENIIWSIGHQIKVSDIVKANNCELYDSKGNKYIDLESGVWCTSIGHSNKRINDVIKNQLDKISHTGFCYCNPHIHETAHKILSITKLEGGKCEFFCSGSEAVEFGMRVARILSKKPKALKFSDSYFGSYGDATKKNTDSWYEYDWLNCSCNGSQGCKGECGDFKKIPFNEIGIFIFEPGSSGGMVRFPTNQMIEKIINKIRANDGIIVINEITTGIGRTGKWFGYKHYNIIPDIVAIGKGIGNGYPVSITAISNELSAILENSNFNYSQSHQNDPLGAVVAGEVIDIITEQNLLEISTEKANYLLSKLKTLQIQYTIFKEIRSRGLMFALEFEKDATLIYDKLIKSGFILAKRSNAEVLRMDPALTIEKNLLDAFTDTLANILDEL